WPERPVVVLEGGVTDGGSAVCPVPLTAHRKFAAVRPPFRLAAVLFCLKRVGWVVARLNTHAAQANVPADTACAAPRGHTTAPTVPDALNEFAKSAETVSLVPEELYRPTKGPVEGPAPRAGTQY